jgi:transposase
MEASTAAHYTQIFEQALSINSPWFMSSVDFSDRGLVINIDFKKGSTFHYANKEEGIDGHFKAYDTVEKEWRHLDFFQHICHLKARVPRIKTPDGSVRLMSVPWQGRIKGFTLLFEAFVLNAARKMPIAHVAKDFRISEYHSWEIVDSYVQKAVEMRQYADAKKVGMDETSMQKGHTYISQFVDLKEKKTLFVTPGKDNSTVKRFAEEAPKHGLDPKNITDVSCDMSNAFIKGVNENLPNAKITFDRFHIMKLINEGVDAVRRSEAADNPILKKSRYCFLKNEINLTQNQKSKLEEIKLSKIKLKTLKALQIRERFQEIYQADTIEAFGLLFKKCMRWMQLCRIPAIVKVAKTLKSHQEGILQWKISQINNGILEGLNSIVQAAKRKARGYKTFEKIQTITYLLTGKLSFKEINPFCC